jgi:hypothetical protein
MKKTFFVLLLSVFTFFSACKKDDNSTKNELKVSKLSMIVEKYPKDTAIYKFDYSTVNEINITRVSSSRTLKYKFDENSRISDIQYRGSTGQLLFTVAFTYNGSTATEVYYDYTTTRPYRQDSVIFFLGSDGLATHSVSYFGSIHNYVDSLEYTWKDHDLVGMVRRSEGTTKSYIMTYDNSYNPLYVSELPVEFFLTFGYDFFMACNKHNCIEVKSSDGEYTIQTESREYNSDNYLTRIITDIQAEQGKFETKFEFVPK